MYGQIQVGSWGQGRTFISHLKVESHEMDFQSDLTGSFTKIIEIFMLVLCAKGLLLVEESNEVDMKMF